MTKHYDLVIFDWDGTLVDSADLIVRCMTSAFDDVSLVVPTEDAIKNIIGLGLNEAIVALNGQTSGAMIDRVRQAYSHHFIKNDVDELAVFDGIYALIQSLVDQSRMSAVATGKSRKGLDRGFSRFKGADRFITSRCADETQSKPNPLMLEQIVDELGVSKDRAIMVGDSTYDMEMAANFGMDSIAVTYGVHNAERLKQFNPVKVVDDVESLSRFLLN